MLDKIIGNYFLQYVTVSVQKQCPKDYACNASWNDSFGIIYKSSRMTIIAEDYIHAMTTSLVNVPIAASSIRDDGNPLVLKHVHVGS